MARLIARVCYRHDDSGATEFHFWNPKPESTQAYAPTQATDGEIVESNLQDKSERNLGLPRTPSYPKGVYRDDSPRAKREMTLPKMRPHPRSR